MYVRERLITFQSQVGGGFYLAGDVQQVVDFFEVYMKRKEPFIPWFNCITLYFSLRLSYKEMEEGQTYNKTLLKSWWGLMVVVGLGSLIEATASSETTRIDSYHLLD